MSKDKMYHQGSGQSRYAVVYDNGINVTIAQYIDQMFEISLRIDNNNHNKRWAGTLTNEEATLLSQCLNKFYGNDSKIVEKCYWVFNKKDNKYVTSCGHEFKPTGQRIDFCPFCGKEIQDNTDKENK